MQFMYFINFIYAHGSPTQAERALPPLKSLSHPSSSNSCAQLLTGLYEEYIYFLILKCAYLYGLFVYCCCCCSLCGFCYYCHASICFHFVFAIARITSSAKGRRAERACAGICLPCYITLSSQDGLYEYMSVCVCCMWQSS